MTQMTISQVAEQAGVRPSTLRYYESIGLLPAPARTSGRRRYDAGVLQRLEIIHTAQQAGFTLAEMRVLFDEILTSATPSDHWHDLIQRKVQEMNALLLNVQSMKNLLEDIMRCNDNELEDCIYWTGQRHKNTVLNAES
jgi:MerR family transcriptional regulator, redox-sensitive transcriptional activator SoxR